MKRKFFILAFAACCLLSCQDGLWNAIEDLKDKYADLEGRVARLEELCKEMNTNIASLQTLVSVILNNDYIVSVTPIMKENQEIGYTITFAIHAPITIYHGHDGKDGMDGENGIDGKDGKDGLNGQDGITPIIGVAQDEVDHAYYWTLNGEWLLDVNGNRIPLTSRDGIDGKDGKDGQDGQDGQNGITPQLKIENGYWYVSTDNGVTWTQLSKAVGENGQDGAPGKDGKDGEDGDSMFSSVTYDEDFVYFELANGTILTVNKYKDDSVQIVDGAIMAEFSVSDSTKVYFSMGDLQFSSEGTHMCSDSVAREGTWRFTLDQSTAIIDDGWQTTFIRGERASESWSGNYNDNKNNQKVDWGAYNAISNGGNIPGIWRTLSYDEWSYLISRCSGRMWTPIMVYDKNDNVALGIVIFPDNYFPIQVSHYRFEEVYQYITYDTWQDWANHGAIVLYQERYWASDLINAGWGYVMYRKDYSSAVHGWYDYMSAWYNDQSNNRRCSVRLVKDVE